MIENLDTFSEKRNLIYSKTNTKGKSTFVRLLFYALGYPIPNMRGIKYEDIEKVMEECDKAGIIYGGTGARVKIYCHSGK